VKICGKVEAFVLGLKHKVVASPQVLNFDDMPVSVEWNSRLRLPGGRPCRWPVNGSAKAVKKEKLFERREVEIWLRILVAEKLRSMAPDFGASFFSFRLLGLR
jgi:hypothetical protein